MSDLKDPRVLFAAERTMLAWNRTSLSLIAFGFLMERASLLPESSGLSQGGAGSGRLTFWLGLAFIALGVGASVLSSQQYTGVLKTLNPAEFPEGYRTKWGLVINHIVGLLGAALVLVLYFGRV